ncbi:hypothetical protein [Polaribacter sp.]|uniref:hypothetical protein n=1 Tax=Polaribacter sp. TaxID=1920175 RepID=UPI003F6C7FB4
MDQGVVVILILILRIVGILVCVNKAKELNRSTGGWGFFGFISPILAMIWIHCMKPVTTWDKNVDINEK